MICTFADDTAIIAIHKNPHKAFKILQNYI